MCKKIPLPKEIRFPLSHHSSLCDLMHNIEQKVQSMSETYDVENAWISKVDIEFNLSKSLPLHTVVVKLEQSIIKECVCKHD